MALTKLVDASAAWHNGSKRNQRDGQGSHYGEISGAEELYIAVDTAGVLVEGEKRLYCGSDDHDENHNDATIKDAEHDGHTAVPSKKRMTGSDNPLCEDEIGYKEQQNTGGCEYLGGDAHVDVAGIGGPDDSH